MAFSTCVKCGGTHWEVKEQSPQGSNYKLNFVQCLSCGTPIGVADYFSLGTMLRKQENDIAELKSKLSHIESAVSRIGRAVR
jgi:hypothetical protein